MTRTQLLKSLRAVVQYHRSCGMAGYGGGNWRGSVLRLLDLLHSKHCGARRAAVAAPVSPVSLHHHGIHGEPQAMAKELAELNAEIAVCRNCPLHQKRIIDTAGSGASRPRLIVVGEWLAVPATVSLSGCVIFGIEEDRMLARMTAALGLAPEEIFVTNIIKCAVPDTARPTLAQASICCSYLKRQIELLSPLVICAMGTFACQTLTGIERPLSVLRGRMLPYRLSSGDELPLMPTYHPTFLLQNPEMKKAAWADLQLVLKELRQAHR